MIVQFTPLRVLFSALFFANCMILLLLLNQLNISKFVIFDLPNNETNAKITYSQIDLECTTVDQLNKEGIAIILRTGAQDASNLAIHFSTTLRCFEPEDILIFSDLEQWVGQFYLHNALRTVNETIKNKHVDFEIYRTIHHYNATSQDLNALKEDRGRGENRAGWKLDKYKFMHMIEEAYEKRPLANWYLFIETDTYVFWPTLVKWLERLDSSKPLYMGSPTKVGNRAIAHSGSGIVLSKAAMAKLLDGDKDHHLSAFWDKDIQSQSYGAFGLAKALDDAGISLTHSRPMCSGERPATIPFGAGHWCEPIVTLHQATPDDISNIWRFQRQREDEEHNLEPILYRDVHNSILLPHIPKTEENWDNLSKGERFLPPPPPPPAFNPEFSSTATGPTNTNLKGTSSLGHDPVLSALHSDDKPNTAPPLPSLKSKPKTEKPSFWSKHTLSINKRTPPENRADAYKSFEHCAKACLADKNCFQYSFTEVPWATGMGECVLGVEKIWTWGRYKEGVRSGWMIDRIRAWVDREENKCSSVAWG